MHTSMASSTSSGIRGQYMQYVNKFCFCGAVAEIKVSNTTNNPKRLFYTCRNRSCTFFLWCHPIEHEGIQPHNVHDEITTEDRNILTLGREMTDINIRVRALEQAVTMLKFAVFSMAFYMFVFAKNVN